MVNRYRTVQNGNYTTIIPQSTPYRYGTGTVHFFFKFMFYSRSKSSTLKGISVETKSTYVRRWSFLKKKKCIYIQMFMIITCFVKILFMITFIFQL